MGGKSFNFPLIKNGKEKASKPLTPSSYAIQHLVNLIHRTKLKIANNFICQGKKSTILNVFFVILALVFCSSYGKDYSESI